MVQSTTVPRHVLRPNDSVQSTTHIQPVQRIACPASLSYVRKDGQTISLNSQRVMSREVKLATQPSEMLSQKYAGVLSISRLVALSQLSDKSAADACPLQALFQAPAARLFSGEDHEQLAANHAIMLRVERSTAPERSAERRELSVLSLPAYPPRAAIHGWISRCCC